MIFCLMLFFVFPATPRDEDSDLSTAIRLYERADFLAARERLSSGVLNYPEDRMLRFWLGKTYFRLRKWDESLRELEKAVRLEPGNSNFHLWLGRALGRKAQHMPALTAFTTARRVGREFEAAVRFAPDNMEARMDLMEFYLEAPGIVGGGKEKAQEQVKSIAAVDRRLGYLAQARFYSNEKKWDLALKELLQAADQFSNNAEAHADLAGYYLERLDFKRSSEAASRSLALAQSVRAKLILAASRIMLKQDLAKAELEIRSILSGPLRDEDPSVEEVHFWLGQCYRTQGKTAEARREFEIALEFNPEYLRAKTGLEQSR